MLHSEIILIALVLLIVFAGFQTRKLVELFYGPSKKAAQEPIKTVVKAETLTDTVVQKTKSVPKKKTTKKTTTSKSKKTTKTEAKKASSKDSSVKKKKAPVKKPKAKVKK